MFNTDNSYNQKKINGNPFQVLVVDDSVVIRGLMKRWLTLDQGIEIVGTAVNGLQAIEIAKSKFIEIIILDIEMPDMNGLDALPDLLKAQPDVKVIMASTLTTRNAEISIRALEIGATDYVPKPITSSELHSKGGYRSELISKIIAIASETRTLKQQPLPDNVIDRPVDTGNDQDIEEIPTFKTVVFDKKQPIKIRSASKFTPEIIAIGSSTGGPQALLRVLSDLKQKKINVPIVITQHMPPTFTAIFADRIKKNLQLDAKEASDKEEVIPGRIYVAPGDYHMKLQQKRGRVFINLTQSPLENFCRPAVDPMLRSIATIYGERALTVILTGMGQDGFRGSEVLTKAGGTVIAQNQETSVIWGMPGCVAYGGFCSAILPINDIGPTILKALAGDGI